MPHDDLLGTIRDVIEREDIGILNILIAGHTGVGKSTLINEVFRDRLATTGQGEPVTKETRKLTKEGIPLAILDTRGLESKKYEEILSGLEEYVLQQKRQPAPSDHIHIAWMCVAEGGRRVEEAEVELHRMLAKYMPVLGVITKAYNDQGFRSVVQQLLPETKNVVRVRALEDTLEDGHKMPAVGLDELVVATSELIPEALKTAFANSQRVSRDLKRKSARKAVATAATLAAGAAATPIPASDAVALVPIQIGMLAGISRAFGIDLTQEFLGTLVWAILGTTGTTLAGRAIAAALLKLIPGPGTIVGGTIAATTAVTLTTTLGEIYIAVLLKLTEDSGGVPSADDIEREFKNRLATR